MQNQYPKKIANLINKSSSIVPTSYQLFYSLLKLICNNISNQDMTPELLDQLSQLYNIIKHRIEMLDLSYSGELGLNSCAVYQLENKGKQGKCNNLVQQQQESLFLQKMIKPFMKYLPKKYIASLISKHFHDPYFYALVAEESLKTYDLIVGNSNSNQPSMTPLLPNSKQLGFNATININKEDIKQKQGQNCSNMQHNILNDVIKNRVNINNKLHINGNNQLSILFWLSCFKFDYAVHFDVFWINLINYVNTVLTPSLSPVKPNQSELISYFPNFLPIGANSYSNYSLKSKIKQVVDPDNKYYVTSASCNELFKQFNQPQFLQLLIQLTMNKKQIKEQKKSSKYLVIKYRWKKPAQNMNGNTIKNNNQPSQKRGTVQLNNFSHNKQGSPISVTIVPKLANSASELSQQKQIMLTGCSVACDTKIFQNRYPPTIRFGSLNDNQICIKNKYISRRQFMIIQEQIQNYNDIGFLKSSFGKEDASYDPRYNNTNNKHQSNKNSTQSKYFIVCLSPSNHTCLLYEQKTPVRSGMIFKFQGIYIQIVKTTQKPQFQVPKDKQVTKPNNKKQAYLQNTINQSEDSQSVVQIQDLTQSRQVTINFYGGILTGVPAGKTQQGQQQDPTLQHLPTTNTINTNDELQCMCISGQNKGRKFQLKAPNRNISLNNKQFQFLLQANQYYIPKNTQILVKNANQVLSGHLSDKIQLQANMKIVLEEIQFSVVQ